MARNEKDNSSNSSKRNRNLQRVEDLYRLADKAHGGFAEAGSSTFTRADGTGDSTPGPQQSDVLQLSSHGWVLHVLADLAEYAMHERLEAVRFCLEDARQCVQQMLGEDLSPDGSSVADAPDDNER